MNELVAALPVVGSLVWTLRPRPRARRLPPDAATASTARPAQRAPRLGCRRTRPLRAEPVALARWCERVARSVRGGDTLRSALEDAPDDESIVPIVEAIRRRAAGARPVAPLPPDAALVATVVSACLDQGGPSAEPLDRAAGVLRARAAERDERHVQSAQARLSAVVLTWLPVAVLALLVVTSGAVRSVVMTPLGFAIVILGSILNLTGWWWMRRIVDRASR